MLTSAWSACTSCTGNSRHPGNLANDEIGQGLSPVGWLRSVEIVLDLVGGAGMCGVGIATEFAQRPPLAQ